METMTVRELLEAHERLQERLPALIDHYGERIYDAPWTVCLISNDPISQQDKDFALEIAKLFPDLSVTE